MFKQGIDKPVDRVERPRQSLEQWAVDLCVVGPDPRLTGPYRGECIDGFVWKEIKGYSTLFACPLCDRSKRDLHPYQAVPSAKKWMGSYTKYTDTEMFQRKQNRREIVDSLRKGAARQPELQTDTIGEVVSDGYDSDKLPF